MNDLSDSISLAEVLDGVLPLLAVLAIGFATGLLRRRSTGGKRPVLRSIVLAVICLPLLGLLVAGALDSAVIGWISGLSMMIAWPVLALLALGNVLGSWFRGAEPIDGAAVATVPDTPPMSPVDRVNVAVSPFERSIAFDPPARPESTREPEPRNPMMQVRIDRDSVHPSDDAVSHEQLLPVDPHRTLARLVEQVLAMDFLPGISGGRATWLVEETGPQGRVLAIWAQQWHAPVFTAPVDVEVGRYFAGREARFFFRYRRQEDPDQLLAQLAPVDARVD